MENTLKKKTKINLYIIKYSPKIHTYVFLLWHDNTTTTTKNLHDVGQEFFISVLDTWSHYVAQADLIIMQSFCLGLVLDV